jgi:hypothetical protein
MRSLLGGTLLLLLSALSRAQEGMTDPSRQPMPAAPPLDLPRDQGQHPQAPFERWLLRGTVQGPSAARRYAVQVVFARGGSDSPWAGSPAWRSDRWWVAQASLVSTEGRRTTAEERLAREGLPASASKERLDLQVDGWSLGQEQGPVRLHLPMNEGLLDLEMQSPAAILSLPPLEGRPLHRTLQPMLQAQGQLNVKNQLPLAVKGRFTLMHEWGTVPSTPWIGWDQALLHFKDGRTWLLDGARTPGGTFGANAQLLEVDAQGRLLRALRGPALTQLKSWTSPASRGRYPISFQLQAWKDLVGIQTPFENQEWVPAHPGGGALYRGFSKLQDGHGDAAGEAFLELSGYAHPFHAAY